MKTIILLIAVSFPALNFAQCWDGGSGADGAFHATVDTSVVGATYNFTSVTIDAGVTVSITGNNPLEIYCQGATIIDGTLTVSGGNGSDGVTYTSGGIGGIGVAGGMNGGDGSFASGSGPLNGTDGLNSGGLNTKGAGWSGGGGAGYASAGTNSGGVGGFGGPIYGDAILSTFTAGSGGGGGSGGYDCGAGGGGAGGGIILLYTNSLSIGLAGQILANGGNGGSDGTGNCGGGGAGSGGTIYISTVTMINDGLISATGGMGGASQIPNSPYFGIGGNGSEGRIRVDHTYAITGAGALSPVAGSDNPLSAPYEMTQTLTICDGEFITVGAVVYNATGIYQDVFTLASGCDSIINTDLTVENAIDVSTTIASETMEVGEVGAAYQWLDCGNGNAPIVGETNQSYTATVNGSYSVIVTVNGCSDTSSCMMINSTGIENLGGFETVNIYPNPTKGNFFIEVNGMQNSTYAITLFDVSGKVVYSSELSSQKTEINTSDLLNGLYIVEVKTQSSRQNYRVVLN